MANYKEELNNELDEAVREYRLSPTEKRSKLIRWGIRTLLTMLIYYFFWDIVWLRWTLIFYIPLSLFGLGMILGFNYWVDKKVNKVKGEMDDQ